MYSLIYDGILNFVYNVNWVLAAIVAIAIPFCAFYAGILMLGVSVRDKDGLSGIVIFTLPAMAVLEGLAYGLIIAGAFNGNLYLPESIRAVLIAAEAVAFGVTLVAAIRLRYKNPLLAAAGSAILGIAPFCVLAFLGAMAFALQLIGVLLIVIAILFFSR